MAVVVVVLVAVTHSAVGTTGRADRRRRNRQADTVGSGDRRGCGRSGRGVARRERDVGADGRDADLARAESVDRRQVVVAVAAVHEVAAAVAAAVRAAVGGHGGQREQCFEALLHPELHEVLARDDADDAVVSVDDHQVAQSERAEDQVGPVERVVSVDLRRRDVDERLLYMRVNVTGHTSVMGQMYFVRLERCGPLQSSCIGGYRCHCKQCGIIVVKLVIIP